MSMILLSIGSLFMKTYKIDIPDNIKMSEQQVKEYILSKLYEDNIFSAGFCALVLGIKKIDFIKLLGKYGVIYFASN